MTPKTWVESVRCFPRAVPPALLAGKIKKGLQNGRFRFSFKQTVTKLAEDGCIESWIGEIEAEQVFQIQTPSNGLCRQAFRKVLLQIAPDRRAANAMGLLLVDRNSETDESKPHPARGFLIRLVSACRGCLWGKQHELREPFLQE